ncbi:MAG: EamA family transporter RarD [Novosphingobium sp.]
MSTRPNRNSGNGLALAFGTYLIWGLMPLYLRLVHQVPPFEFVGWRILFTLPLCLVLVLVLRQGAALRAALAWPVLRLLLLSAVLIGINWLVYIAAVQSGHVLATSIGYYINPLANVLAGTLLLGERLSQRQWLAVGLAAVGVSLLAWDARDTLWISLTLAASFCAYGVVRKLAPVESLAGLTVESMVLLVPALGIVSWYAGEPGGSAIGVDLASSLLIAASGLITAAPLLMFAMAARRMDYSALGMVQFVAPTIVFFLGLFVFHEPLNTGQLACFVLIWAAIAVFMWDLLAQRRLRRTEQAPA